MDLALYFLVVIFGLFCGGVASAKINADFKDIREEAKKMRQQEQADAALGWADRLTALSPMDSKKKERYDILCERAGYAFDGTTWNGIEVMSVLAGALAAVFTLLFLGDGSGKIMLMILCVAAGIGIPKLVIHNAGKNRSREIQSGMASALELLSVTVKAGYPLERGIKLLGTELDGPIGEEFARVDADVNYLGMPLERSLTRMAERCNSYTVSSFTTAIINAVAQGTAVSRVLENQAHTAREERYNEMLVRINKIPTKMVPVMYFLFMPAIMLVAMVPPIYNAVGTLAGINFGVSM